MAKTAKKRPGPLVLHGVAAAPGVAVGRVAFLDEAAPPVEERTLDPRETAGEAARFRAALSRARAELEELRNSTERDLGEAEAHIFDVQLMVLQDPLVVDRTVEAIGAERKNAEFLFCRHAAEITDHLEGLADSYFSERAIDLHDVRRRVLKHLSGEGDQRSSRPGGVLVGRELTPSEAVQLDPKRVKALVTEHGSMTSHASIMARARGIPAVVGVRRVTELIQSADIVAVDGLAGTVVVDPPPDVRERYRQRRQAFFRLQRRRERFADLPAETSDGHRIRLSANMELPEELEFIRRRGADDIGLLRTEFLFIANRRVPTEDEQYAVYREVVEGMEGDEVVVRVFDVGGDKVASYLGLPLERNPYLGMRGIRYLLSHPKVFQAQLRAILRAGVHGNIKLLFPMISSIHEFTEAKKHTRKAIRSLRRAGVPHDSNPELGVMIEVPSAVVQAEELAQEADFLSIGSNDLIQYMLAVDRDHEVLENLYQPLHPAILRSLQTVVDAARRHGREVGLCGEMAGEPLAIPLLIGLGMDRLSVSPYLLPEVKESIRSLRAEPCRRLAARALKCLNSKEVEELVRSELGSEYSGILRMVRQRSNSGGSIEVRLGKQLGRPLASEQP